MPIIRCADEFNVDDLYVDLADLAGRPLVLKCEGANLAGSIKLKTARAMVAAAERAGSLHPGSVIVESSSGNLGVALAMVAVSRGYRFRCVTDARCNLAARQTMIAYGAEVEVILKPAGERGLLGARLDRVAELAALPGHVWLNQYTHPANPGVHEAQTGPELLAAFPALDVLFVGIGSAGTAVGCARYLRQRAPRVRIVGIDAVGSVSFGGPPGVRHIPGLGAAVPPPHLRPEHLDDAVLVPEAETVATCRRLAARGFLFGGSTGTVVAGALRWLAAHPDAGCAVGLSADFGDRYLDTLYHDPWIDDLFPGAPELVAARVTAGSVQAVPADPALSLREIS